ncbi:hypothetical protein WR25_23867 [Diploscapter pachys]|uniref:Uncharacterized protein n=1 Tax=Diploscapter pachys TaxID=2018661 RepID=A0A2A2K8G0_9BILA|nr:hypothetical protein WR25_23867 [Diploscapter pachys]
MLGAVDYRPHSAGGGEGGGLGRPGGGELRRLDQGLVVDHQHLAAVEQAAPDIHGRGVERRVGDEGETVRGVEAVQVDAPRLAIRRQAAEGQQHHRLAVLDHERLALGRGVDVQRHVDRRTLEHGQLRDQQRQRAWQQDRHMSAGRHPLADQPVRQAVGLLIELGVTQLALIMQRRQRQRMARHLLLEQAVHGHRPGVVALRGVVAEQSAALLGRQDVQPLQALLGIMRQGLDQVCESLLEVTAQPPGVQARRALRGQTEALPEVVDAQGQRARPLAVSWASAAALWR